MKSVFSMFLLLLAAQAICADFDFVVALDGNDAWPGKLAAPNAQNNDGPFATIDRARQAVRELKTKEPERKTPIVVQVRGGTYFLKEPLSFSAEDSGSETAPVVYAAYPNEAPVISGGRVLGLKPSASGRWEATLDEVKRGEWIFSQLFAGGERRYRPRLPKDSYYVIAGQVAPLKKEDGHCRFRYNDGDIRADWKNLNDVEVLTFESWTMSRLRIASIETDAKIVNFTGHTASSDSWAALKRGGLYIVENVAEALERPGEWYLDRPSGTLTYIPMPGEKPGTEIIAPKLERLLQIKGDYAHDKFAEHLHFRGIAFAHTNWVLPPKGYACGQAEIVLSAAISAEGARNCSFENCAVAHTDAYAIEWGAACKNDRVENCELTDLGAGGIKIGETRMRQKENEKTGSIAIRNNLIAYGGRVHPAAIGVWIGQSAQNTVENNEIFDFYYSSVSIGWTWGYGPSGAHHNTVAYNHMHKLGQGVLSDMGGIYTLGISHGTVLHHNLMHDVQCSRYGAWGVYYDEGSTGIVAEKNITYRCQSGGFHQHYGKDNRVTNSIVAFGEEAEMMRSRAEDHLSFTFDRNIVYWKDGPLLGHNWSGDKYALDYNVYYKVGGAPIVFEKQSFADWQKSGKDQHSLIADPLFADADKFDFRLKDDSPALKMGFAQIETEKIGRQGKITPLKDVPRAFPPPPGSSPPSSIMDDFEHTAVGMPASDATTHEESKTAVIRVTDETAASGKHSLKFTDGPGQQHAFSPHMYYDPNFKQGVIQESFSLRVEPKAIASHEWRDVASPYHTGPSLWVRGDGTVQASGRTLLKIPLSTWVRFEIVCGLGSEAKAKYEVTVTLPDAQPQKFSDLPCDPNFKTLRWYGFASMATEETVFYLDDLMLRAK